MHSENLAEVKWVKAKMVAVWYVSEERRHHSDRKGLEEHGNVVIISIEWNILKQRRVEHTWRF